MANLTKRIIDLQTTSTLGSDDYVMIDGATNGTKKYLLKDVLDEIEDVKDGTGLATGAVTTDKLAAGAVTNAKIGDGAVDTTNIADDAVTAAKIDDGAVGTDALAAGAVTGAKIATGAVGTGNIASGAVTLDKIASDSNATSSRNGLMSSADKAKLDGFSAASNYALKSDIVGAYIFKGSVNTENDLPSTDLTVGDVYNIIAASSYGESGANVAWTGSAWDALGESFDISDGAIDTEQLADGAVTNGKLAEGAKTTVSPTTVSYDDPTYGSGTRQGYDATFGNSGLTIRLPKVSSGLLIDVENIPTIPEKKIGYGAVTANKIAAGAVGTEKLANSAVTTDKLATAAVSTDKIASLAVTTNKIAAGAVDNSKLANNAVGTAQIANGAVTAEKLGSDVTTTLNSKAAASDVTALREYVDEELENKADIDGYYSQLTAGLAENLIGRGDAVPAEYLYRTAGGTADIEDGIATVSCIKGNTVTWNQVINIASSSVQGNASTIQKNGTTVTATGLDTAGVFFGVRLFDGSALTVGHKYLFATYVDASSLVASAESTKYRSVSFGQGGLSGNAISGNASTVNSGYIKFIYEAQQIPVMTGYVNATTPTGVGGSLAGQTFSISNPQLFDLTLMFGAGNEPSTVEEFEAMFPLPYYPYSAPKLLPVDMRGIETVGFNQHDPSNWEIDPGHGITVNSDGSIDLIQYGYQENYNHYPIPGIYNGTWHLEFDVEVLSYSSASAGPNLTLEYSDGTVQKRRILVSNIVGGTTHLTFDSNEGKIVTGIHFGDWAYNAHLVLSNICLNMSWSGYRNGEYEEHWSAERPIDTSRFFPTGMKKVGDKADALYADHYDTVVGAVDLGTLTWVMYQTLSYAKLNTMALNGTQPVICAAYNVDNTVSTYSGALAMADKTIAGGHGTTDAYVYLNDSSYDNVGALTAALSGVMLYYELATPTTTEIDPPLNLSYKVSDFGTERIMVDETADAPQTAPVPMEVEYGLNAIDTIRRLPTNYVPRKELEPKLDEKADVDGYYAAMTVGAADNLTGRGDGVSGRYLYRTAGGDEDIADGIANIRSIKGQTLVWNQMVPTPYASQAGERGGVQFNVSDDYVVTADGVTTSGNNFYFYNTLTLINGHKYLLTGIDTLVSEGTYKASLRLYDTEATKIITHIENGVNYIFTSDGNYSHVLLYLNWGAADITLTFKARPQLFDLTLMFGAGNEPTTVAEFEALFPKPYYPYSEPTLLSVNMEGIETVGFNQWDEEWEVGSIDSNGVPVASSTTLRSKNFIRVFPNTEYFLSVSTTALVYEYDADQNFIRMRLGGSNLSLYRFTTSDNCRYLKFRTANTYGGTYKGDICLNLSWSGYRNGEYEEYWKSQREIPVETYFPDGMRSVGTFYDELVQSLNFTKAITRVGAVDLGTLTWNFRNENNIFYASLNGMKPYTSETDHAHLRCAYFNTSYKAAGISSTTIPDKSIYVRSLAGSSDLIVNDTSYGTDKAAFKAAMSGVMLYYELAEPTEVTIDPPLNLSYKVSDFGTEKVMVDEETDAPQSAPPIIQTAYGINATDTVRRLPTQYISHESFQQFVAALQSAVGITVTETWDENDGRYEYTVTQTGE